MLKHAEATMARVRNALDRYIAPSAYGQGVPLELAAFHVHGEPISRDKAIAGTYEAFEVGDEWGSAWDTTWFRMQGEVPPEWEGQEVRAVIDLGYSGHPGFGAEGIIWQNGEPVQGISPANNEFVVARNATGFEEVAFYVEAAANPPPKPSGPEPVPPPDPGGKALFRLTRADLVSRRSDVGSFALDFRSLLELAEALQADDPRSAEIIYSLNEACNLIDLQNVPGTFHEASKIVAEMLGRAASTGTHRVSALGHAHIDTAWLWPFRETQRKCARSFASVLKLMDDYPEFKFGASQALHYELIQEHYPALFKKVTKRIAEGRWEPLASMWVEPDCNIPSGESLVRQLVHGKQFVSREFGQDSEILWLPDSFGFSAALPQIMQKAGINYFMSQKLSWNDTNDFPHHTFLWEGIDGTRIFSHFPPAGNYNGGMTASELVDSVRNFKEKGRATRSLFLFGHGDGGGGPTREMVETASRFENLQGAPRVSFEPALDFFKKAEADAVDPPIHSGELYLEYHRGTYTSQAKTKRANRQSEVLLREAEHWSCLRSKPWTHYPGKKLDEAWKLVLLNQFHDILPGTSIDQVYEQSATEYGRVYELAQGVIDEALASITSEIDTKELTQPVVVFNSTSHARLEAVEVEIKGKPNAAVDSDGAISPVQMLNEKTGLFLANVPAHGYAVYDLVTKGTFEPGNSLEVEERRADNGRLTITWDLDGLLTSVWDKQAMREVLAPRSRGNLFQIHPDYPNKWDAWDVDPFYAERWDELTELDEIKVVEEGPVRIALQVTRSFGASKIVQTIRLVAGSPLLEFHTTVDWQERHKFLKTAFPVDIRSDTATYEIQFGHIRRATHMNTSWDQARYEVWAHRWADLSEPGFGVALLNDCKYGYDIHGGLMRLSLLRAPEWPDPNADRGTHEFAYALLPHIGSLGDAGVIEQAASFNIPLRVVATAPHAGERPGRHSFLAVDGPGAVIDTIKKAEQEDAMVIRLYEARGGRSAVSIEPAFKISSATTTDLLEREETKITPERGSLKLELKPFEIATLKLR